MQEARTTPEHRTRRISPDHYASLGDHSVIPGDLLIASLGDRRHPPGRACVAPATLGPAMVKADCFRFRLNRDRVKPGFAAAQLTATAPAILSTGATRQRTNLEITSARKIGIPPLDEQFHIIDYIGTRTDRIRIALNAAEREINLLNEYRTRMIADCSATIKMRMQRQSR